MLDYTDVRYGGSGSSNPCVAGTGEITTAGQTTRLIVSNSSITDSMTEGISINHAYNPRSWVGVYDSTFARSGCGIGAWTSGATEIIGNTFAGPFDTAAMMGGSNGFHLRAWFNTVQGLVGVLPDARCLGQEGVGTGFLGLILGWWACSSTPPPCY
jgi:hypothetical protein